MNLFQDKTLSEIVANDFRTAAVFSEYKLDFCCRGSRNLHDVCKEKEVDYSEILAELNKAISTKTDLETDFNSLPIHLLVDYIIENHHTYINQKTPVLIEYLEKLCRVHGNNHSELFEVKRIFKELSDELASHLLKEEEILFPYIKNAQTKEKPEESCFGSVQNPISMMMTEHEIAGDYISKISQLTNNYSTPEDACSTYSVTLSMLKEFEKDLHKHIHLENNILFKKAIELEKQRN